MSSSTFGTSAAIIAGALVIVRLLMQKKDADEWQRRWRSGRRVSMGIAAVRTGRMWPRQLGG